MKHAEVVIARRAVEEGRGLVVIVNKMDLLRDKHKSSSYEKVLEVVPQEIQTIIPQVCYNKPSFKSSCPINWTVRRHALKCYIFYIDVQIVYLVVMLKLVMFKTEENICEAINLSYSPHQFLSFYTLSLQTQNISFHFLILIFDLLVN